MVLAKIDEMTPGEVTTRPWPHGLRMALALFSALLLSSFAYRQRLLWAMHDPMLWADEPVGRAIFLRQLGSDVALCLSVSAAIWCVALLFSVFGRPRWLTCAGLLLLSALLFLLGLLLQAQHGTLVAMRCGLSLSLLRETLEPAALRESFALLPVSDYPYLGLPLFGFWGAFFALRPVFRLPFLSVLGVLTVALLTWAFRVPAAPLQEALLHHPLGFLVTQFAPRTNPPRVSVASAAPRNETEAPELIQPDEAEPPLPALSGPQPKMALGAPVFAETDRAPQKNKARVAQKGPFHIVFLILESTGAEYVARPLPNGKWAMPFLHSLTEKGLYLSHHYSAGNSSPRGIFSALSGLYVMPESGLWDVRKDVYLPSLVTFLGPQYRHFLVTPASLDWYFPHGFLLHSGMNELWGYHNLPIRKSAPGGRAHAKDETEAVSFFLKKIEEATARKEPFVGVYYSFLAHWPYPDYGPATHVMPPTKAIHLYLNNLHFLDQQIERIYGRVRDLGLLGTTLFVLLGDHGEAFGQHPHNYTHSRQSFNENYRTPALLLHPELFPPRVVNVPTSHVDILPTLLDALSQNYDPESMQGESLFQTEFRRKYIFLYGNEDTLSSVSALSVKLQVSLRDGTCWAFDLQKDPGENRRLSCGAHKEQHQALLQYRKHQQRALRIYNAISRLESVGRPAKDKPIAPK